LGSDGHDSIPVETVTFVCPTGPTSALKVCESAPSGAGRTKSNMSLNSVQLIGHLGQDPELRKTADGTSVANLSIATNDVYSDRTGERQKQTEWHRIVAFGILGERCAEHLFKGRQIHVEGRLQTRRWTGKLGVQRDTTVIVARTVKFLG